MSDRGKESRDQNRIRFSCGMAVVVTRDHIGWQMGKSGSRKHHVPLQFPFSSLPFFLLSFFPLFFLCLKDFFFFNF